MSDTANTPTMYRCADCGVWWSGSHTCPTVAQPFPPTFSYDGGVLVQILDELRKIRALLEAGR